jgi:hypothetical protein
MTKLNLGCGYRKLDGFINIDNDRTCEPDLLLSLGGGYLDFPNGSVTEVRAIHVLEHLSCEALYVLMIDLYRVMAPDALMYIAVPHPAGDSFWGDPSHVTPITVNTLRLFSKTFCDEAKAKGWPNTPFAHRLDVDFEIVDQGYTPTPPFQSRRIPHDELKYAMTHNVNVIDELTFTLRRV